MRLLLDTHTFIWWTISVARLSAPTLSLLQDRQKELLLSLTSLWEMQLKLQAAAESATTPDEKRGVKREPQGGDRTCEFKKDRGAVHIALSLAPPPCSLCEI